MRHEALIPVLRGEIPLKAHAHRAYDILTAIRIAKEFGVKLTLEHCTEGHLIVEHLVKEKLPLAVGPTLTFASKPELAHKSFETAGILDKAGCEVSIITDSGVIPQEQLSLCAETWHCSGLLLDFQRPGCVETAAIAKHLASALPCPTAVSAAYAGDLDCAVCLPPVPPSQPLEAYLSPWSGRETWLELALDGESITLTEQGAATVPLPCPQLSQPGFRDDCLHCHYRIHLTDDRAEFTLWRTEEDLADLMEAAETLGVTAAVGLYQELWNWSRRALCPQPAANQGTAPS